jgi:hypothetical protein
VISVEVVYATPERVARYPVSTPPGATVGDAIAASGVLAEFPELDLATRKVGIFGRVAPLDHELAEGDRIEIYRPLVADPKDARRMRARERRGR